MTFKRTSRIVFVLAAVFVFALTFVSGFASSEPANSRMVTEEEEDAPKPDHRKAPPKGTKGPFRLTQFISTRAAEEYLETLDLQRYEAYYALVDRANTSHPDYAFTDAPTLLLVLKEGDWKFTFQGQRFAASGIKPISGDARKATLAFLDRHTPKVYRAHIGGDKFADLAIILETGGGQWTKLDASTIGDTIHLKVKSAILGTSEFSVRFKQTMR